MAALTSPPPLPNASNMRRRRALVTHGSLSVCLRTLIFDVSDLHEELHEAQREFPLVLSFSTQEGQQK